ncbi:hypothetical protein C1645_811158 [Glomus cerebriforme]|uniref:Crinkler effector protein N-terminal domain-containing protein n=1 Tax=Glomus cerebriforme TaxID=658196 RepID=A0A397TWR8_9GLOM|nr:hypothetical protein C1645_811158 [Glomus cerebriforme]
MGRFTITNNTRYDVQVKVYSSEPEANVYYPIRRRNCSNRWTRNGKCRITVKYGNGGIFYNDFNPGSYEIYNTSSGVMIDRIMVDINLFCHLFRDIDTDAKESSIDVNTSNHIDDLKEKIYEEVKKKNNDFLDIEAEDLRLWKVEINNNSDDKFSSLVLKNNNMKNITKL